MLVIFLMAGYFIRCYFFKIIKTKTEEYLLKYWFSLRNIIIDMERLTYLVHFMREHEPLADWQILELKVRLQRAENALMEARTTLERYKPTEKNPVT
jgi:hypothetical protein